MTQQRCILKQSDCWQRFTRILYPLFQCQCLMLYMQALYSDWDSANHQPPSELKLLSNLEALDISGSNLCGVPLPDAWSALTKLKRLDISSCFKAYDRMIPAAWAGMSALQELRAENAGLAGGLDGLPISGGGMPQLRVLLLAQNFKLSGTLPAGEGQGKKLMYEGTVVLCM